MLDRIWAGMMIISVIFAAVTGRIPMVSEAALKSGSAAFELCVVLLGSMMLWNGVAQVMTGAGLINALTKAMSPVVHFLFPSLEPIGDAAGNIVLSMAANVLGLGNSATPIGLRAMKAICSELKEKAEPVLVTFTVMNAASFQFFPSTLVSLRASYGSYDLNYLLPCIWISTAISLAFAIAAAKAFKKQRKGKTVR